MKYRIFYFFIELIHWLLFFLSPVLGSVLLTFIFMTFIEIPFSAFYYTLPIGIILGVLFAERTRRKYGCANFWSMQYATPDIWPTPLDKQHDKK